MYLYVDGRSVVRVISCVTALGLVTVPVSTSVRTLKENGLSYQQIQQQALGPVAPISVNFNYQLTQHDRHDNSNSRATSANSSIA